MAKMDEAREAAQAIASGLKQLGPDRKVALSTHKTKALIVALEKKAAKLVAACLLYTSPSPRDISGSRMPSSA